MTAATPTGPGLEPAPVVPQEVSVAANSIGYAIQQFCHLDLHVDAVTAAAQRLYDQGLLKPIAERDATPTGRTHDREGGTR